MRITQLVGTAALANAGLAIKEFDKPVLAFVPMWLGQEALDATDFEQITHAAFAFTFPNKNGTLDNAYDEFVDEFIARCRAFDVAALISFGGPTRDEAFFPVATNDALLENIVTELRDYVVAKGFDGVDVDWEQWRTGGDPEAVADEIAAYLKLMQAVREALGPEMILTTDVFGTKHFGQYYPDEMIPLVDYVNVLAYEMTGGWPTSPVAHHANFNDVLRAVDYWHTERNLAPEKFLLGLPMFGKHWPGAKNINFNEVMCADPNNRPDLDSLNVGNPEYQPNGFIETPALIAKKFSDPAMGPKVGGAMIWEIFQDCHPNSPESLLHAVNVATNNFESSNPTVDCCAPRNLPARPGGAPSTETSSTDTEPTESVTTTSEDEPTDQNRPSNDSSTPATSGTESPSGDVGGGSGSSDDNNDGAGRLGGSSVNVSIAMTIFVLLLI